MMIIFVGQDAYPESSGQRFWDKQYPLSPDQPVAFITHNNPKGNAGESLMGLLNIWNYSLPNPYSPERMEEIFNRNNILLMNSHDLNDGLNEKALIDLAKKYTEPHQFVLFGIKAQELLGKISEIIKESKVYVVPHPSPQNENGGYLASWERGYRPKFTSKSVLINDIKLN